MFIDLESAVAVGVSRSATEAAKFWRQLPTPTAAPSTGWIFDLDRGRTHVLELTSPRHRSALMAAIGTRRRAQISRAFVHTNACGDFTLMAREHWFDLRGYPEFDLFSMNLDSVLCVAAHHGGAREQMLAEPMRIYHIEHGTGSGWTPEGQAKLFERIAARADSRSSTTRRSWAGRRK